MKVRFCNQLSYFIAEESYKDSITFNKVVPGRYEFSTVEHTFIYDGKYDMFHTEGFDVIEIDFTTVTNFGTGQYKVALPFTPAFGYNHFSGWIWADPDVNPDTGTGHTILNADTSGNTTVLDLHYLKSAGGANTPIREGLWAQGTPVALTTISKAYINGTYICVP